MSPRALTEKEKRDRALDLLAAHRFNLIEQAKKVAIAIEGKQGYVTSTMVLTHLREDPEWGQVVKRVDPRFMGAVFRKGWRRAGWTSSGSHKRPVPKWVREER